jgi:hypothetical protein
LLTDEQTADGRRDHGSGAAVLVLFSQIAADSFSFVGILQKQSSLKKTVAVQAAAQLKVTVEQSAGTFQNFDNFTFSHGKNLLFRLQKRRTCSVRHD